MKTFFLLVVLFFSFQAHSYGQEKPTWSDVKKLGALANRVHETSQKVRGLQLNFVAVKDDLHKGLSGGLSQFSDSNVSRITRLADVASLYLIVLSVGDKVGGKEKELADQIYKNNFQNEWKLCDHQNEAIDVHLVRITNPALSQLGQEIRSQNTELKKLIQPLLR